MVVDNLGLVAHYTAKSTGDTRTITVATTGTRAASPSRSPQSR